MMDELYIYEEFNFCNLWQYFAVHLCQLFSTYVWACRVGVGQHCIYIWDSPTPELFMNSAHTALDILDRPIL